MSCLVSLTTPIFHDVAVIRGHRGTTSPYRGAQGGALIQSAPDPLHGQRPLRHLDRPPKGLIQMTHGSHDAPPPLHAFRMNIQPRVLSLIFKSNPKIMDRCEKEGRQERGPCDARRSNPLHPRSSGSCSVYLYLWQPSCHLLPKQIT